MQFLRDSGFMHFINEHQVRIVKFRQQKGRMADELNLSHFIDNRRDCLASVIRFDNPCCIQRNDGFMVHFTGSTGTPVDIAGSFTAWANLLTSRAYDLAIRFTGSSGSTAGMAAVPNFDALYLRFESVMLMSMQLGIVSLIGINSRCNWFRAILVTSCFLPVSAVERPRERSRSRSQLRSLLSLWRRKDKGFGLSTRQKRHQRMWIRVRAIVTGRTNGYPCNFPKPWRWLPSHVPVPSWIQPLSEADDVHLKRIALAINKSEDTLRHQFKDIKPRAQQNQSGNNDGWALAVQQIYATKSVFRSHPTDVLEDAMLLKYLIGLSSSGVEQLFSQTRWALGKQRLHAKDENEEMIIKLMADLPHHDLDKLINLAQRVWAMCFNPPKQSPQKPRIDKGVKRLLSDTDDAQPPAEFDGAYPTAESEAAFIRKRRRAIRQCVVKSERNLADVTNSGLLQDATRASTSGAMEWTEGHDKELKFIKNKIGCRKACALAEGQLLDIEITEEVREVARATRGRRRKDCQARERKAAGDKKKLQGLMGKDLWGQIKGTTVFIDRSVTGDHTPLIRALQANNMAVAPESELAYAAVFVTSSDRGSVSQRVNLASAVKGAFQISPELVMSSGAKGNAIKFFPAAMSKRCLYVSHAATQHHKELWSCFKKALASSPCVPRMVLELHENVADDKLGFVNTTYKHMPRDVIVRPGEATHPAKLLVVPNIYSHCNMIGVACHGWDTGLFVLQARVMCAY